MAASGGGLLYGLKYDSFSFDYMYPIDMMRQPAQLILNGDILNYSKPVFDFEENFDELSYYEWHSRNWTLCFWFSILYIAGILAGQKYMENRPRYDLRLPLIIWSTILAVFSITATLRVLPELHETLYKEGFQYTVCNPSYYHNKVTAFWSMMFVASKVYELGDTFFIVFRKQKLIFLHWYHHVSVLIYVWQAMSVKSAPGRWFYVMNYIVHSFMYTYYALKAMRFRLPQKVSAFVTTLQIGQMMMGMFVISYTTVMHYGYPDIFCQTGGDFPVIAGQIMYISYFVLFVKFFYDVYIKPKPPRINSTSQKENISQQQMKKPQLNGKVEDNNNINITRRSLRGGIKDGQ